MKTYTTAPVRGHFRNLVNMSSEVLARPHQGRARAAPRGCARPFHVMGEPVCSSSGSSRLIPEGPHTKRNKGLSQELSHNSGWITFDSWCFLALFLRVNIQENRVSVSIRNTPCWVTC